MAYQTMDISIKGGWFKDAWDKTSKEIQIGLDKGNENGWKLITCIQTVSQKDINVYLLIWETE
jgi:ribosomal protein S8